MLFSSPQMSSTERIFSPSPWHLTHRLSQSVFRAPPDLRVITALAKSPYTSVPGPAAHGRSCYRNNHSVRSSEIDPHTEGTKADLHLPPYQPGGLHSQNCIRCRSLFPSSRTRWFSCISEWVTRHSCQIESLKQTDEYMVHCSLLSLPSSLTLNQTTKHICTKNAQ